MLYPPGLGPISTEIYFFFSFILADAQKSKPTGSDKESTSDLFKAHLEMINIVLSYEERHKKLIQQALSSSGSVKKIQLITKFTQLGWQFKNEFDSFWHASFEEEIKTKTGLLGRTKITYQFKSISNSHDFYTAVLLHWTLNQILAFGAPLTENDLTKATLADMPLIESVFKELLKSAENKMLRIEEALIKFNHPLSLEYLARVNEIRTSVISLRVLNRALQSPYWLFEKTDLLTRILPPELQTKSETEDVERKPSAATVSLAVSLAFSAAPPSPRGGPGGPEPKSTEDCDL